MADDDQQQNLPPPQDASAPQQPPQQSIDPSLLDPSYARPELIDSIIHHESSGRPGAISPKGARGLMQVMPQTAAQYGVTPQQLMDPEINKQVGTQYFSDLLKQYKGNEFLALVAYNEGPGNLSKGKFFPQSVHYATSVLDRAGSRLKGMWQGAESALGFGDQGQGQQQQQPPPQQGAQAPQATGAQQQALLPWALEKLGGGISSLLGEGTAQAEETPPDATGAAPPAAAAPPAGAPPAGGPPAAAPPGATPPAAPPAAVPAPPPPPTAIAGGGGFRVDASGRYIPPAAPAAAPAQRTGAPAQPPLERQGLMVDSTGRWSERFAAKKVPVAMQTQLGATQLASGAVKDALGTWDTRIAGHEKDFEGTLKQTPRSAIRGALQYTEYTHSRFLDPLGMQVDPDVAKLYSQIGPIIGQQLKALVGGRIGQYMIDGPLAAHIPNGDKDSLRMIHEKLVNLQPMLEKQEQRIMAMKQAGMSENDQFAQTIEDNGETPVFDSSGNVVGAVPSR